jgi:RNA polymerase sigma-70 factor (ECF subfamily)
MIGQAREPPRRAVRTNDVMPMLDADAEWVNAAYAAHGRELYRFAYRSLGDAGLAEEAVQTTYLRAWRSAERFDDALGSLRTWLFAIARNVVIDLARARSVRPPLARTDGSIGAAVAAGVPDAEIDQLVVSWQVEEGLRRLSDDHRAVLVETYYRGRAYDLVAQDLGIPVGTVKSRVYYALKALRLALDELGWSDDG